MSARCCECGIQTGIFVYETATRAVCIPCYKLGIALRMDAVKKLPDEVEEKTAPSGYHQIGFNYYKDELKAKAVMEFDWVNHWGMRN